MRSLLALALTLAATPALAAQFDPALIFPGQPQYQPLQDETWSGTSMRFGNSVQSNWQSSTGRSRTCTSMRFGNSIQTTCN